MTQPPTSLSLGTYVSDIVSAYVANHAVESTSLPVLIQFVQTALSDLTSVVPEAPTEEKPQPAVPIKRSVFPDYIICLEDGKKLKMLKRHLKTAFNLEPSEYRQRWGLPSDYPMVAPAYTELRSSLAKQNGLGREAQPAPRIMAEPGVQRVPEGRRGRVKTSTVPAEA